MNNIDLEMSLDLIHMRGEERNDCKNEEEYFLTYYGISEEILKKLFDFVEENRESSSDHQHYLNAFVVAYEIGRTHQQIIHDGINQEL